MLWDTPDKQMNFISLNFIISSRALASDIIRRKIKDNCWGPTSHIEENMCQY